MTSNNSGESTDAVPAPDIITIHILCPSISPTRRFTVPAIPLDDTVANLRARIQLIMPSHPSPAEQRLIFRGRSFNASADSLSLREVLAPLDGHEYSIHLVLPPAPVSPAPAEQPSSFPFTPSNPSAATVPSTSTLPTESLFSSGSTSAATPSQAATADSIEQNANFPGQSHSQIISDILSRSARDLNSATPNNNDNWTSILQSTQTQTSGSSLFADSSSGLRNRSNVSFPERSSSLSTGFSAGATGGSHIHLSGPRQPNPENWPSASGMANRPTTDGTGLSPGDFFQRLFLFRDQVAEAEQQIIRGSLPSAEALSNLRFRLFQLLVEGRRNPPLAMTTFTREIESLEGRLGQLFRQHDITTRRLLSQPSTSSNGLSSLSSEPPRVYLATSPEGNQGLVVSLGTTSPAPGIVPPAGPSVFSPLEPTRTVPLNGPNAVPRGAPPNEADVQNVLRQAVVNQQRRQNEAANGGAGGHIRRIWLFVRLYFFIYMISESGTWTRILFVTAAVLVSLLSDSELPQQMFRMLVTPMQRHIERLAHVGAPAEQPDVRPRAVLGDALDYLWRAERSIVLLLASLIPGIGERQVQARSTAEAEAEQRRLEEERRQSEEQNQQSGEGQGAAESQQGQQSQQPDQQEESQAQPQPAVSA